MKESYFLIKNVKINETEKGFDILTPEETAFITLNKKKSTDKYFLFEAVRNNDAFCSKVPFKVYFCASNLSHNYLDSIKVINTERFAVVYDEKYNCYKQNGCEDRIEYFSLVTLPELDIYISDTAGPVENDIYSINLRHGTKFIGATRVKSFECTTSLFDKWCFRRLNKTFKNKALFYTFDNELLDKNLYYFDDKGSIHVTDIYSIKKEYKKIKANF